MAKTAKARKDEPRANTSLAVIAKLPHGRPSTYSEAIADEICERIAAGETLTGICLDEDMPAIRTVSGWLMRMPEFSAKYASAREAQMHIEAEQMREIADNAYEDYFIDYKEGPDGSKVPFVVVDNEGIRRAELRIRTRQWRAERLNRRVYAPKVEHEHHVDYGTPGGQDVLPPGLTFLAGKLSGDEAT